MIKKRKLQVEVRELKGDSYGIGVKQGASLQRRTKLHAGGDMTEARSQLQEVSPSLFEELTGLSAGMGVDVNTVLQWYGGYDLQMPSMGCTSFSNGSFYVRNYDFNDELYDARLVLIKPDNSYASIGFSQQITGRLDGMNEKGLVIGLHLVNEEVSQKGFLSTTICRLVLDQCATTDEAISLIKQIPHQHCFNFSLTDSEGNNAIVEASPEEEIVHYNSQLMCTNHFESERLKNKNRALFFDRSMSRKKYLKTLEHKNLTPTSAYHIFNNESSPLFFKDYQEYFGTLHTVVYCPKDLSVVLGVGGNYDPYEISFAEWLEEGVMLPKILEGTIDGDG